MSRQRLIAVAVVVLAGAWLVYRVATQAIVSPFGAAGFGVWCSAFLTLCVFSFLAGDNPFYKFSENLFVGVSAAYWMVTGFWSTLVPNLFAKLAPGLTSRFLMSGLEENGALPHWDWHYLIPLIFGVLLLWRLMPKGGWISRWSLAFIVGITAGNRLITYLASDFIAQTQSTMKPLIVMSPAGAILWGDSFNNLVIVVGVITGLCYFYFSKEHTGWFGRLARVGIWSLMITFGAGFGYTVMGRVALLVGRMEFIFIDWLHLASR